MAFGVEELRVLRRALALALDPTPASADDVQDCLRLAESLDEALREGARLRAFLVADLGRYRAALPGTAAGYLALLDEALGAGYQPLPDDLAALRALRGNPAAAALLDRCAVTPLTSASLPVAAVPGSRTRLLAIPGGRRAPVGAAAEGGTEKQPEKKPARKPPAPKPAPAPAPGPDTPKPSRPIPTPGEVFPRRKPAPPPPANPQQLAAG
ncbi:hypothetical protein OR263_31815 [Streptomyces sp. NEAU-H22]|uniref:hypothetical protein n=1 Tax=unclassified Streptomyces TaxID=2593676 RepID=UPI00225A0A5F|nr:MULTISPECIES: hypothetical protein [unclassified Streptomyces]MCX3291243.1 hypothetical protein [Streptomyces sp. NEAU-H22]WMD09937.1 hypothetical protein Q7C01_02300 [Streptomyces sp. FXY-T5]